jgi:hypothetical protein
MMEYCVYYDGKYNILDYMPSTIPPDLKQSINEYWSQEIPRKLLIALSEMGETAIPLIKLKIGHSMSTLHETIMKLEQAGLVETKITYVQNKKKTIIPKVLFVTKNPQLKIEFKKFFQGMWIDSNKTKMITSFLQKNHSKYFTIEEISGKLKIPVDEVEMLLSNWDSLTTRTLSNYKEGMPFEKKIMYRGKPQKGKFI